MKRSKFTDEQIAFALKQAELGISVEEFCRKMGISDATSTCGARSTAALGRPSCDDCANSRKRTGSWSRSSLT